QRFKKTPTPKTERRAMGKHKKNRVSQGNRPNPISRSSLGDQLESDRTVDPGDAKSRSKARLNKDETDPEFVDEKMTQKILKEARKQQQQLEDDLEDNGENASSSKGSKMRPVISLKKADDSEDSDDDFEFNDKDGSGGGYEEEVVVDPEEEKALMMFMNKNPEPTRRLADLIMEKITEKQTELESEFSDAGMNVQKLDPRVEKMYEGVKDILKRYRSGKLPKAFKLVPRLINWEQVLQITDPDGWTAAAMYQATRIFTSNLKEKMAQRFFNLVLLPRVRDDILQYKKLNFHLYQALRKALFKPGAFMKGILIPLCESGDCTLREAVIIGSVLAKNSVPLLHSAAAMLKIAEMDYSGANSIFLRVFLDKKYALPYRVVDAVVYHFIQFETDKRELPVLWHQALLVFVQRYKENMSSEQKEALHNLLRAQVHYQITPEVRRELQNSRDRDEIITENDLMAGLSEFSME
ncbi:unnamed protein product, partial [Allacma fusca]